jgi:hypothetical protein
VYQDGSVNPARGVRVFETAPENYYTRVPDTGAVFSVDIDFDTRAAPVRNEAVEVDGVHYSKTQRKTLSGDKYGTGARGAEAKRLKYVEDARLLNRVYFYVDEGKGVQPEPGVGTVAHRARLTNLYDGSANPLKLPTKDKNEFESAVIDAGYSGYYVKQAIGTQGVAVLLGDAAKDVAVEPYDANSMPLFQGERGAFDPNTLTISLMKGADLSTFIHESGHLFLDILADMATRADAPQSVVEDFDKTMQWFGVAGDMWLNMTLDEKRQYHEQWAQSFERWTLEGKAPASGLHAMFARFRTWMIQVYKSMEEFIRRNPASAKLDDDIRGVFSRLYASEEAIAAQERTKGYADTLAVIAAAGGDPNGIAELQTLGEQATAEALQQLNTRSVRDMKWASRAKNKFIKKLQDDAAEKRKVIEEEVTTEVMSEPVNVARKAMTGPNAGIKIDTFELGETFPGLDVGLLRGMTSREGYGLDQLADMFGYQSGRDMVGDLLSAEDAQAKIQGITDQRMLERHGELIDARAIEQAANEAVHSDVRSRFLATGLSILTRSPVPVREMNRAAKQAAQQAIAGKKIREIKPKAYEAAETRATKDMLGKAAKDPQGAITAQRAALLNNHMARAAVDALAEVDKGVERAKQLESSTTQKNMRGGYLEQLNALLARFDLRKGQTLKEIDEAKQPLKEWLTDYADELSAVLPDVPEWIFDETYRKHYKDMTVEEFRGVMDAIRGLELLARRSQKQYIAVRDQDFKEEREAILARIRANHPDAFDADGKPKGVAEVFVRTFGDAISKMGDKFSSEMLNSETLISILEGGNFGQLHDSFIGRISARLDWKFMRLKGLRDALDGYLKPYSAKAKWDMSRKEFGKIGGTAVTRENAIIIALLHGSADGQQRLANYGWTAQQQLDLISKLDDRDLDLVEGIWKIFDHDIWPELEALNKRTRGKAPPKIQPQGYSIGRRQMTGGYFKLKYSDEKAHVLDLDGDLKSMMGGAYGDKVTTRQGSSTERKEKVKRRPRLDMGLLGEAVSETVHDIALREAVADTMRLLNDRGIQDTLINVMGRESYRALIQRVKEVVAKPVDPATFIEKAATIARKNTVITLMSGLGTALQNVTGFFPAMHRVPIGSLLKEIALFSSVKMGERYAFTVENSTFMRGRFESYDRSLHDEARKLAGSGKILPESHTMLWFLGMTDRFVAIPVWNAAFRDGLNKFGGDHSQAVNYADHIIRQTQGSGRDLDVAAVMGGGPLRKVFTMFYSYFNAMLGALVRSGAVNKALAKKSPALATALFTKDFLLIVALPAVVAKMLLGAPQSDEEEEEEWTKRAGVAIGQYGLAMFPLVRDVGNFVWTQYDPAVKNYGFKLSPIQAAVETMARTPGAIADIIEGEGTTQDQKNAILGVSYAVGLPGKLISNTWTGVQEVMDGGEPNALVYGAPYRKDE